MAKVLKVITDVIFVVLIVLLATYLALRFMGFAEIYRVQTGSMEDGIHAGDYILIHKKDKYGIGDVVTYKKDNYHVTHRIIKKNGNKIITKGDANNIEDDEISEKNIVGKVIYNGGYLNFIVDYKFALASALLALYLFSCYFTKKEEKITEEKTLQKENEKDEVLIEENDKENNPKDLLSDEISEKEDEEDNPEDLQSDETSEKKDKKDIPEDLQSDEITSGEEEKIKEDLSLIYETDKKKKKNSKKKKNNKKKQNKK